MGKALTPRQAFVEAMREWVSNHQCYEKDCEWPTEFTRQAAEAFARIEWFGSPAREDETVEEHITALLKEIGI